MRRTPKKELPPRQTEPPEEPVYIDVLCRGCDTELHDHHVDDPTLCPDCDWDDVEA